MMWFYFLGPNNRLLCEFAFGNGARGSISIYCRIPTSPEFVKDLWLSSLLREWWHGKHLKNAKHQHEQNGTRERLLFRFFLECSRSFASRDLHYPSSPRNWLRISLKSHWKRISWKLPCKSNQIHAKYPGETMLHHLDKKLVRQLPESLRFPDRRRQDLLDSWIWCPKWE